MEVRVWSEAEFLDNCSNWQVLLESSAANNLFMSWSWMSHWWRIRGKKRGDALAIHALYDDNELIGLAPLYFSRSGYFGNRLTVKRLQFLGTRFGGGSGIRSEYLSFICRFGKEKEITETLLNFIVGTGGWDELILSDVLQAGELDFLTNCSKSTWRVYRRVLGKDDCYSVSTTGKFQDYLQELGKNTRLKLYNRRKMLATFGNVKCVNVDPKNSLEIFDIISGFHAGRFGGKAFKPEDVDFVQSILTDLHTLNFESKAIQHTAPSSTVLMLDGEPLSAMLNITCGGRVYNIQLGFKEDFHKKISVGTLHLGYAIESAFVREDISSFDLLAGEGKNCDYKKRLARQQATLVSLQLIRRPLLKLLYRFNDTFLLRFKPNAVNYK